MKTNTIKEKELKETICKMKLRKESEYDETSPKILRIIEACVKDILSKMNKFHNNIYQHISRAKEDLETTAKYQV